MNATKRVVLFFINASFFTSPYLHAQPASSQTPDSLKKVLLTKTSDDTGKINLLNTISYTYRNIQPDSGLYYGNLAIASARKINFRQGLAKAFLCLGSNYQSLSDSLNAMQNYQQALDIYRNINDKDGVAWSFQSMGNVYLFVLSDYSLALHYYHQSQNLFQQLSDKKGLAVSYANMAISYENLGDYPKALQQFQQAENIDEQLHDEAALAVNYSNMGIFYDDLSQFEKALDYCKKALAVFGHTGNQAGISHSCSSIGTICLDYKKNEEAITWFTKALQINRQMNDKLSEAKTLGSLGLAYAALFNFSKALQCQQQSVLLNKALGNKSGLASALNDIGDIYLNAPDSLLTKLGFNTESRYNKAAETLHQSLQINRNISDLYGQEYALQSLSKVYEKQNNYFKAYTTYKDYITVRDSILNDEKQKEITRKEISYEYDKKEAILTAEQDKKTLLANAEIKKQKLIKNYTLIVVALIILFSALMIASYNRRRKIKFNNKVMEVETKALRAQMNPHFIFNSLHSINSYIAENDKENASGYLSKFAVLMRLILENSREQEVPLESDLHALELYIQLEALRSKNAFTYSIETDPDLNVENTLIPPMLLQPFVENAILHGVHNKENGLIKISVRKQKEMICCTIEDNGTGDVFSHEHGESKAHKSLGKKIITERLNIINQLKKVQASVKSFNLTGSDNKPAGMRVELLLPLEQAF